MRDTRSAVVPIIVMLALISLPACSATAPAQEKAVRFSNGSVTLAGSLVLPAGAGRHSAVVLFHGSGPESRNMRMARWFASQGVAALTYDKRGVGASGGDFRKVPFMDLCGDGLAAVAFLKARSDIDPHRIGVWGLSQGGWLGPLAASQSRDVAFVIAVSGPGVSPGEQMIFYYGSQLRNQGLSEPAIGAASVLRRRVWQYLATGKDYAGAKAALVQARSQPWFAALQAQEDGLFAQSDADILDKPETRSHIWFRLELNYDPGAALRKLSVPALFVFGDKDELVPVTKSVEVIRSVLSDGGNPDFTIKVFPGADHVIFVTDAHGGRDYAPGYREAMRDWLRAKGMS